MTDREDRDTKESTGVWKRKVVTSPELLIKVVFVFCAQQGLCPLRLLTSVGSLAWAGLILRGICKIEACSNQTICWKP